MIFYLPGSTSHQISIGYNSPADALSDTVKYRTFIDGGTSSISFGARKERIAEFKVINVDKDEFLTLTKYLIDNAGHKIKLTPENSGESIFTMYPYGEITDYYVYVLEAKEYQEEDFTKTRELFTISIRVALAGVDDSSAIPNPASTSTLEILLDIDTTLASAKQSSAPTDFAYIGERWFDTDDNKLYEAVGFTTLTAVTWTASSKTLTKTNGFSDYTYAPGNYINVTGGTGVTPGIYKIASKTDDSNIILESSIGSDASDVTTNGYWKYLYTVAADSSVWNFVDGTFYWSAFSNTTVSSTLYKAGVLNFKGVKFPGQNIHINSGPAISRRDGFSFSIKNVDNSVSSVRFWEYIVNSKVNLYGAKVTLKFRYADTNVQQRTGTVRSTSFMYRDFRFNVEPFMLNRVGSFPGTTIQDDPDVTGERYDDVKSDVIGVAPYVTYGIHSLARLQNISTNTVYLELLKTKPDGLGEQVPWRIFEVTRVTGDNNMVKLRITTSATEDSYAVTSALRTEILNNDYMIKVIGDEKSDVSDVNIGEIRKITGITVTSDYWELEFTDDLLTAGVTGDKLTINVISIKYQFQIDEENCGGFGKLDANGVYQEKLELLKVDDNGRDVIPIPSTSYGINNDEGKNIVFLRPELAANSDKLEDFRELLETQAYIQKLLTDCGLIGRTGSQTDQYDLSDSFTAPTGYDVYARAQTEYVSIIPEYIWVATTTAGISGYSGGNFPNNTRASSYAYPGTENIIETDVNGNDVTTGVRQYALIRFYNNYGDSTATEMLQANSLVKAFRLYVEHRENEADILTKSKVYLALKLDIVSQLDARGYDNDPDYRTTRVYPLGFDLHIRFKKYNGDFVVDATKWKKSFSSNELGVQVGSNGTVGSMLVDNVPNEYNADDPTFAEGESSLIAGYDIITSWVQATAPFDNPLKGELWVQTYADSTTFKLNKYNGSGWEFVRDLVHDEVVYKAKRPGQTSAEMLKYDKNVDNELETATEGVDYTLEPIKSGKTLFDISAMFGNSPTDAWSDVESMEILVANHSAEGYEFILEPNAAYQKFYYRHWYISVQMDVISPQLYIIDETQLGDTPLFSAVKGRASGGTVYTSPKDILTNILSVLYPRQYNVSSINTLLPTTGERAHWVWHRQFTTSMSDTEVLLELLWNLWAVAVFNSDDELAVKPLELIVDRAKLALTDSNIVQDSISEVRYRDENEIYQKFTLMYDYNLVSEVSKAAIEFNEIIEENQDTNSLINTSKTLYNLQDRESINILKKGFKYFYKKDQIYPLPTWIIKHFAFNAWTLNLKLEIEKILTIPSGFSSPLELMDVISLNSYFHTGGDTVLGFVTAIKPSIYDGTVEISLFIPNPPGKYGALCDYFKDALNITNRNITDWSTNDQINDGDKVSTRSGMSTDDAGRISTREFCT